MKRSIQIFNGVGDAVHKIHMRDGSNHDAWDEVIATLRADDQDNQLELREKGAPRSQKAPPRRPSSCAQNGTR